MTPSDLESIVESLVFASGDPLPFRKLAEILRETPPAQLKAALASLRQRYEDGERGIRLVEVAGGYQLRTATGNAEYVRMLFRERPGRLSRPAMETLAIVAYKQPITKAEIEAVRGVEVDGVLQSLLARSLIRTMGRKDAPGRPWVYGTTAQFLEVFGLRDLSSLPPLAELEGGADPAASGQGSESVGTPPQDPEPGGDHLAAEGRGDDRAGAGAGEWQDGGEPRDQG